MKKILSVFCLILLCFSISCSKKTSSNLGSNSTENSDNDSNDNSNQNGDVVNTNDDCYQNPGQKSIGSTCTSGAIFIGSYDYTETSASPFYYMMTPKGCDTSVTTNPTCVGADDSSSTLSFLTPSFNGTPTYVTNNINIRDGKALTLALASSGNGEVYTAAKYCQDLVFGGYNDWYLPTQFELAYVGCHVNNVNSPYDAYNVVQPYVTCPSYSASLANQVVTNSYYLTSSEKSATEMYEIGFDVGGGNSSINGYSYSKTDILPLRCVRRWQ